MRAITSLGDISGERTSGKYPAAAGFADVEGASGCGGRVDEL